MRSIRIIASFLILLSVFHINANEMVISDVNVIDVQSGKTIPNQDVIIKSGMIKAIQQHDANLKADIKIDGKNQFLMPGLMDMHVHYFDETNLKLNIANGVTYVRNMWGTDELLELIKKTRNTKMVSPTLTSTSIIIDGDPPLWKGSAGVANADQAKAIVAKSKDQGYDSLKIYSMLSPDVFNVIAQEAKKHQLQLVGHIPLAVGTRPAVKQGMRDIHHMTDAIAFIQAENSPYAKMTSQELAKEYKKGFRPIGIKLAQHVDLSKTKDYARFLKENNVWSTVTLLVNKTINLTPQEREVLMKDERLKYVTKWVREFWNPKNDFRLKDVSEDEFEKLSKRIGLYKAITKALSDEGAKILLGTDTPNPFVYPGSSVHEELALMVESGLSPLQALQTATINPAEFLGRKDLGKVSVGVMADLVLLEKNPLESIKNSEAINGVIKNGRWFAKSDLNTMLVEVAEQIKKQNAAQTQAQLDPEQKHQTQNHQTIVGHDHH